MQAGLFYLILCKEGDGMLVLGPMKSTITH